jgi:hypothetical protein
LLRFILAVHADGQYQANTFQDKLLELLGAYQPDPYFLLPWDVSHWMDIVMVHLREDSDSSEFLKRLIKRSNKMHTMFQRGRGHVEYIGLAKRLGLKALETVTFSTTRFTSSSYEQWEKIYTSYKALMTAFMEGREAVEDDCEEAKYQVRGQDYVIDLCGTLDIMKPAIVLMVRSQSLNLPPWKIVKWLPRVTGILEKMKEEIIGIEEGRVERPSQDLFPKLHLHWDTIKDPEEDEDEGTEERGTFQDIPLLVGWLIVSQETINEQPRQGDKRGRKQTVYNWNARTSDECLSDLAVLCRNLKNGLETRFNDVVGQNVRNMAKMFDLESLVCGLCSFVYENGSLRIQLEEREMWELSGNFEFSVFFKHVCQLPYVRELVAQSATLNLLPHCSNLVYRNLKNTKSHGLARTWTLCRPDVP